MKIILINGQPGTGKSAVGTYLKNETKHSAYIDADALLAVNPLGLNEDTELLLGNFFVLAQNFFAAGYTTLFSAGITRNQMLLDLFFERMPKNTEVVFVWLYAHKEVRMKRKRERARDAADKDEHFDVIDQMYPDARPFHLPSGTYIEIDTSEKSIKEIAEEIQKEIL